MGIPSTVPATILTFFRVKCDTCVKFPARCYKTPRCVATNVNEKHEKSWNEPETVVTLHQKSEMISIFDLLIQKKYKGLTISTLSAYHISSFLTEKEKEHKRQKNIFRHKDKRT